MKKKIGSTALIIWFAFQTFHLFAQRTDSVDVLHYNLETNLTNIGAKTVSGVSTITCIAKFSGLSSVVFDLQKLQLNAIYCNNQSVSFTQNDSNFRVNLGKTFQLGDTLRFRVEYGGTPVTDSRWGGFYFTGNYAFNMGVGMASNPPTFGRCWFPCIDNFTDKATYEFHVTTDTGYMAVCNGLQELATPKPGGQITWNWRLGQEIPTYIANVAVSKYALIQYNFQGLKRLIPVTIAVNPADTAKAKASFANLNDALRCFEDKFGPYVFDRVGYVGVPFNSGAMEHAGNISYPIYAIDGTTNFETLFAHELSHHWWGNLITTKTAGDMWLNEGFASYCEAIFLECVYGREAYDEKINNELFEVLRWAHVRDGGYRAVSGVPLAQTYGTHVYTKGSLMVHSLRMLIQDDTAFFNTLKSFLTLNAFKNVSSNDLKLHFEKRFGGMIGSFFESYIYDKGHVDLQLAQMRNISSGDWPVYVPVFKLMSRYKSVKPDTIYAYYGYYETSGPRNSDYVKLVRNKQSDEYVGPNVLGPGGYGLPVLGEKCGTMLGNSLQMVMVKGNSVQNFTNAFLTITPTQNSDSNLVIVEHHFAGPWQNPQLYPKGIRISSERYWHIGGEWFGNFKANAFFNYDGSTPASKNSGFLDNELITGTEDSLVLLYRKNAQTPFTVASNVTIQPGSKTDKAGRFIVNSLATGDYVFGYYDFTAGKIEVEKAEREMKVYPNPVQGLLTIELPKLLGKGTITLINSLGTIVLELKVDKSMSEISVNTHTFSKGTYFVVLEDEKGKVSKTIVIE